MYRSDSVSDGLPERLVWHVLCILNTKLEQKGVPVKVEA